jgi:eukaryotic-like serine/threonine-protein kinase
MSDFFGKSLGRYHVLEKLGEGGMAVVYKAFDTQLEKEVAVKVIRTENIQQSALQRTLKRFEREAKALIRLTHPNIVSVLDHGEQDGVPYLVMPYLPGGTLKEEIVKVQRMDWQKAAAFLAPIGHALEEAHCQDIIHRDVKPANILITASGQPMLSDFGVAKVLHDEETMDLTGTGVGIGTPAYMAPEQGLGKPVDARTDIYALGIVFYELVTGRKPYSADTPMAVLHKQLSEPLPRPSKAVPDLPLRVEQILLKALAKDPGHRYQTMGTFALALEEVAQGNLKTEKETPKEEKTPKKSLLSKKQWAWILGGGVFLLVCLLALGGLGFGASRFLAAGQAESPEVIQTEEITVQESTLPPQITETPIVMPSPSATPEPVVREAKLVHIPVGEFVMGSDPSEKYFWGAEAPQHDVFLDEFWIYDIEVTNAMYRACDEADICPRPAENHSRTHNDYYTNPEYDNYPVVYVTYPAAQAYCKWVGGRLPSEAEWEKAARGTDGRMYPWGDKEIEIRFANFCDVGCPNTEPNEIESGFDDGFRDLAPVASFPDGISPFGVYDMAGNALEWVADWYGSDYYSSTAYINPTGPTSGSRHPIRGGSWYSGREGLRTSARASLKPDAIYDTVGFRCVVDSP